MFQQFKSIWRHIGSASNIRRVPVQESHLHFWKEGLFKHFIWTGSWNAAQDFEVNDNPASILRKSTSGRHRPVSYPDGPMTARYRFT